MLSIDTEGRDFDVLFGASSTLDRSYYLEFEYHIEGDYPLLFCFDVSLQSLSRNSFIEKLYHKVTGRTIIFKMLLGFSMERVSHCKKTPNCELVILYISSHIQSPPTLAYPSNAYE